MHIENSPSNSWRQENSITFQKLFKNRLYEQFISNIPIEYLRPLVHNEGGIVYLLGIFIYCIPMVLVTYITLFTYNSTLSDEYVSLTLASNCQPVPKPLTGTYLGSYAGAWQGSQNFKFNDAVYEFEFTELTLNPREFEIEISKLKSEVLVSLGESQSQQTLPYNLLIWMNYYKPFIVKGQVQKFGFTGMPQSVFNLRYKKGGVGSNNGVCSIAPIINYDISNAVVIFSWNADSYFESCSDIINNTGAHVN